MAYFWSKFFEKKLTVNVQVILTLENMMSQSSSSTGNMKKGNVIELWQALLEICLSESRGGIQGEGRDTRVNKKRRIGLFNLYCEFSFSHRKYGSSSYNVDNNKISYTCFLEAKNEDGLGY